MLEDEGRFFEILACVERAGGQQLACLGAALGIGPAGHTPAGRVCRTDALVLIEDGFHLRVRDIGIAGDIGTVRLPVGGYGGSAGRALEDVRLHDHAWRQTVEGQSGAIFL